MSRFSKNRRLWRLGLVYGFILFCALWLVTNRILRVEDSAVMQRVAAEARFDLKSLIQKFDTGGREGLEKAILLRVSEGVYDGDPYFGERFYRVIKPDGSEGVGNMPSLKLDDFQDFDGGVLFDADSKRPGTQPWWKFGWFLSGTYNPNYDLVVIQEKLSDGSWIYVGRDFEFWGDLSIYFQVTTWGLVGVTVLALAAGMVSSRSILKQLSRINLLTREIVETNDLSNRIPELKDDDEFRDTILNLNRMMDKIEGSVTRIKEASDSIAHDMRTPLTRLRNRLEEIIEESRSAKLEEVEGLQKEVDSLLGTFRSILRISQVEMNPQGLEFSEVDLGAIVSDAVELYRPVALEKKQSIKTSIQRVMVQGDANLLFQMVSNLMDNACKYSPQSSTIYCRALLEDVPTIVIQDEGPGIPEDEREKVFTRFYRMEKSRTSEGVGLGLSMVTAISKAHGISVDLEDASPGLQITLRFVKSI